MPRKADFLGTARVPQGVRNTFRHRSHILQRSAAFRNDGHILQRSAVLGFLAGNKRVELEPSGRGFLREADEE